ncbi:Fic family protein [Corynebacterium zhongnanshanii]|uniref:Fic family protein n=2 Tax=Corynebacterium zhongnanshanii TaxID=2768834 RepID=A0ABQ6VE16_9CORY|nr:Fic family protein [Corynebacterium zhongnanshanii]
MSSSYKPLKTLFHMADGDGDVRVADELRRRWDSPTTHHWSYVVRDDRIFVLMTTALSRLIDRIWVNEVSIAGIWQSLPESVRSSYTTQLLVKEIRSTHEIEHIYLTGAEIMDALTAVHGLARNGGEVGRSFIKMVRTYTEAFNADGALRYPQTVADIRQVYDMLLSHGLADEDALDGQLFRAGSVSISNGMNTIHAGAVGEQNIIDRMQVMLDSSTDRQGTGLVNAMVEHFMLEHTHPFYDGNGRFGRFLLTMRLAQLLSKPTALSLSGHLLAHKTRYYKAFQDAEHPKNHAELTFFVQSMLSFLQSAQEELLTHLNEQFER